MNSEVIEVTACVMSVMITIAQVARTRFCFAFTISWWALRTCLVVSTRSWFAAAIFSAASATRREQRKLSRLNLVGGHCYSHYQLRHGGKAFVIGQCHQLIRGHLISPLAGA